ncbi:MAG: PLP-dependent aminotransferase family protein [Nocardia sp.]|uniref:MocR-like pyridoxine biosynthesis transcription factor PdxR n=1 Tax=Nocardia sp. TaxID=1821 RepID=UPI00261A6102|nr:PLP-dependent aminotransferase family protein [Nocardia sp.]MCU1642268.1 PLP-dependent aminotransferase family protein [Nocardia sp.]
MPDDKHAHGPAAPIDGDAPKYRQVRAMLEDRLAQGVFAGGRPMPSSRFLAQQLGVSRNTVAAAYDELIALGVVESRPRSGLYAAAPLTRGAAGAPRTSPAVDWASLLKPRQNVEFTRTLGHPDAFDYPYPFISSQPELRSFPVRGWLRAVDQAMTGPHLRYSIRDAVDQDDPLLVEVLRREILPSRGIHAAPEEILVTGGTQQGLSLIADVLMGPGLTVGFENPGYLDAMHIVHRSGARLMPVPVDGRGAVFDEATVFDAMYLTPSHHHPTNVTLSLPRRKLLLELLAERNGFVIEDDYDSEFRFRGRPTPSLKSLDDSQRVIYLGSFSKFLSAGLRIGYIVADAPVIAALRAERHHRTKHLPGLIQRSLALFIESGEFHKVLRAHRRRLAHNWELMTAAMARHLPEADAQTLPPGGVSIWYAGPETLDAALVTARAARRGVLVADGSRYFFPGTGTRNCLRLGFASIAAPAIDPGIALLGSIMREVQAESGRGGAVGQRAPV